MFEEWFDEPTLQIVLFLRAILWAGVFATIGWLGLKSPYAHMRAVQVLCALCFMIVIINVIAAVDWWIVFWG